MKPTTEHRREPRNTHASGVAPQVSGTPADMQSDSEGPLTPLRRRADAARRLEPLDGRHGGTLAGCDPALPWPPAPRSPSTFGMTPDELRAKAERLLTSGWQAWEIRATLARVEWLAA